MVWSGKVGDHFFERHESLELRGPPQIDTLAQAKLMARQW
jgi:hypothetical protein